MIEEKDNSKTVLVLFNLIVFITLITSSILYYNMLDDGVPHERAIIVSMSMGLIISVIITSVIFAVYKTKNKHDEDIKEKSKL